MSKLVGIAGSLRAGSFNAALLRAAAELMPNGSTLEIAAIKRIPLYDGDVEKSEGIPQTVTALQGRIAAADGLLLVTPEYNNSMPGVFKNAIDWLSRPPADIPRVLGNRPVAVIGASPGGFGTVLAQNAWLPVLRTLGTRPWFDAKLLVSRAGGVFNDGGEIIDEKVKGQPQQFVQGRIAFLPYVPITLKALKQKEAEFEPKTLGDHIKKRRLELKLTQAQASPQLGVDPMTILNWEKGKTTPPIPYLPAIHRFLGYAPFPVTGTTIAERLIAKRRLEGWTQRYCAKVLGVDSTALAD